MGPLRGFHGEVVSADASGAGVAFTLYLEGETAAYTLKTNEHIEITDISILRAESGAAGIFVVTDADGERIWKGHVLGLGAPAECHLLTPHLCPRGVTPVLIADAGDVAAILHGHVWP